MKQSIYKENGFLSAVGEEFVSDFKADLSRLLDSSTVESMTISELRHLKATISTIVGNAISNKMLEKK